MAHTHHDDDDDETIIHKISIIHSDIRIYMTQDLIMMTMMRPLYARYQLCPYGIIDIITTITIYLSEYHYVGETLISDSDAGADAVHRPIATRVSLTVTNCLVRFPNALHSTALRCTALHCIHMAKQQPFCLR